MCLETFFTTIRENHCRFEMILNSLQPFFPIPPLSLWILQPCFNIGAVSAACHCWKTVCPLPLRGKSGYVEQRLHLATSAQRFAPSTLTSWDRPHRVKSLIVSHEGFKGPRVCKNQVVYHWHPRLTCRWIPYNEKSLSFYLFFLLQSQINCWISPFVMSLRAPIALTKLQFQQEGKIKEFCGWWKQSLLNLLFSGNL